MNKLTHNGDPHLSHRSKSTFLDNFRNLNKQLNYKLYQMPNINEMLLKVDGFNYSTLFDLNMGYYYIQLSEDAIN